MTEPNKKPRTETQDVLLGIGLALLVLPVQWIVGRVIVVFFGLLGLYSSVFQFLPLAVAIGYFVVVIQAARNRGRPGIVKGIIIGISVMVLLLTACVGLIFLMFSGW